MPNIVARVVNPFKENIHKGHIYNAGDVYPADCFEATEDRVYFLTGVHPKYNKIYLADVTITEDNEESEYPKHTGGGYYELSNGNKVKGKEEAIEAENALKIGE